MMHFAECLPLEAEGRLSAEALAQFLAGREAQVQAALREVVQHLLRVKVEGNEQRMAVDDTQPTAAEMR